MPVTNHLSELILPVWFPPQEFIARGRHQSELLSLSSAAPAANLAILSITVLSNTTFRVTFNLNVMNNPALLAIANYRATPGLVFVSVAPVAGPPNPLSVIVTVVQMQQGGAYTLYIDRLVEALGNSPLSGTFVGQGTLPTLVSAVMVSDSVLRVTWSRAMAPGTIGSVVAYSIAAAGGSVAATIASLALGDPIAPVYVDLTLAGEVTIGVLNYTLTTPAGATDLIGDVLTGSNVITFNGRATAPVVLYASGNPGDLGHLRVAFSKAMKQISALNTNDALHAANYMIPGATVVSVVGLSASIVQLAVTGQGLGAHTLTVINVQDLANNPVPT